MAPCPILNIDPTLVMMLNTCRYSFSFFMGRLMWEPYKGGELEQDVLMLNLVSCPSQMYKSSNALTIIFT